MLLVLGITGTLWGLSMVFETTGSVDAASRAQLLAKGISEAMNCTAFTELPGLGQGTLFFNFFKSRPQPGTNQAVR